MVSDEEDSSRYDVSMGEVTIGDCIVVNSSDPQDTQ